MRRRGEAEHRRHACLASPPHPPPRRACSSLLAGVIGGPVAGSSRAGDGFVPPGADSEVAVERVQAATGRDPGAGHRRARRGARRREAAVERRLASLPGVAAASSPRDGLVTAQLDASADGDDVAQEALDAFAGTPGVTVGGPAVAGLQIGETVGEDLGRAELIAFPFLLVLSLLFFRGRATLLPARGRDRHRAGDLPRAHRDQRDGLQPQRLRAQPRDRPRPRAGDRLHAVPRHPLPGGARRARRHPRGDRRDDGARRAARSASPRRPSPRRSSPSPSSRRASSSRWASPARPSRSSPPSPRSSSPRRSSRSGARSWRAAATTAPRRAAGSGSPTP